MIRKLTIIFDRALGLMAILAGVIIVFMLLSVSGSVVGRYFFSRPIPWITEISEFLLLYITFLMAAYLLKREGHVRVDILVNYLRPRTQAILGVVTSIIGAAACLVLAWYGALETWEQWSRGTYTAEIPNLPNGPILVIIPIGSFLFFIQFLRRTRRYVGEVGAPPDVEAGAPTELRETM